MASFNYPPLCLRIQCGIKSLLSTHCSRLPRCSLPWQQTLMLSSDAEDKLPCSFLSSSTLGTWQTCLINFLIKITHSTIISNQPTSRTNSSIYLISRYYFCFLSPLQIMFHYLMAENTNFINCCLVQTSKIPFPPESI